MLVGHSCGATLALQAVMGLWKPRPLSSRDTVDEGNAVPERADRVDHDSKPGSVKLPVGIVGLEGIYDIPHLLATHDHPVYQTILESAFGTDQSKWKEPSPVNAKLKEKWTGGKVVVLAQSKEDELVDWVQTERMSDALWRERVKGRRDVVIGLTGKHEEIWEKGEGVGKAITKALEMLSENDL